MDLVDKVISLFFNKLSRSVIREGNGNPLQCSCLENPRDWGAWWAAVYGVTQSWTWLKWLGSSSSRCVIAYIPNRKHPLISCLQSPPSVVLEPKKIKSVTASTFPFLFAMKWCDLPTEQLNWTGALSDKSSKVKKSLTSKTSWSIRKTIQFSKCYGTEGKYFRGTAGIKGSQSEDITPELQFEAYPEAT